MQSAHIPHTRIKIFDKNKFLARFFRGDSEKTAYGINMQKGVWRGYPHADQHAEIR